MKANVIAILLKIMSMELTMVEENEPSLSSFLSAIGNPNPKERENVRSVQLQLFVAMQKMYGNPITMAQLISVWRGDHNDPVFLSFCCGIAQIAADAALGDSSLKTNTSMGMGHLILGTAMMQIEENLCSILTDEEYALLESAAKNQKYTFAEELVRNYLHIKIHAN